MKSYSFIHLIGVYRVLKNISLLNERFPEEAPKPHGCQKTFPHMTSRTPILYKIAKIERTSQNIVNLSSGKSPFASSMRKSRRMNFLNPQSLP